MLPELSASEVMAGKVYERQEGRQGDWSRAGSALPATSEKAVGLLEIEARELAELRRDVRRSRTKIAVAGILVALTVAAKVRETSWGPAAGVKIAAAQEGK